MSAPQATVSQDDVHCWCLPAESAPVEAIRQTGRELLSATERAALAEIRNPQAASRWLLSRVLLRRALAWHLALEPAALQFGRTESGKPHLVAPANGDLAFNLSHAGGEMLLAVTRAEQVGIDLEHTDRAEKALRVARHFFAPDERADIERGDIGSLSRPLVHWLLKEAVVKAVGATVWDGLTGISFAIDGERITWRSVPPGGEARRWKLQVGRFRDTYLYATASVGVGTARPGRHYCHVLGLEGSKPVPLDAILTS